MKGLVSNRHTVGAGNHDDGQVPLRHPREPLIERADIDAILGGIFDIRAELRRILQEDDDGEGEEEEGDESAS